MKRLLLFFFLTISLIHPVAGETRSLHTNFFTISLSSASLKQGQTLTVFVNSANRLKRIELEALGQRIPLYHMWHKAHDHLFRGFVGIPARTRPGRYKVKANGIDIDGNPVSIHAMLTVRDARFKIQRIRLTKKKTKLMDNKQLRKEGKVLAAKFEKRDRRVYFSSAFHKPARGRISSAFGLRREYNGHLSPSYHKGLDIANKTGTPVYASNGGRVSIAVKWKSHGRTILINHGHGIVSVYIHLNKILVKTGDWVKRGQLIGRIGSSGIATGPHLHFGISVNDIRVDPAQWIENQVLLYY